MSLMISLSGRFTDRSWTLCRANGVMRGLGEGMALSDRASLAGCFGVLTTDGEEDDATKAGSGGGGGGGCMVGYGGGGGGGLRLPLKDELGGISASGDGGGGNSGEVEQAGGGLRV